MTPKEKAQELYEEMLYCYQGHIDAYTAKQCSLITVKEILEIKSVDKDSDLSDYWEEVKQEIEKL